MQIVLDGREKLQDGLIDAQGRPAAGELTTKPVEVGVQLFRCCRSLQTFALIAQQALVGLQGQQALVVQGVIILGAGCQLHQHLPVVLAAAVEQLKLLIDLGQTQTERVLAVVEHGQYLAHHALFEQLLLLRDDALAEQCFQSGQLTAGEQGRVFTHLGEQCLLGRQRQYGVAVDAQMAGCLNTHALDGAGGECIAGEVVPEYVDLVHDGEQATFRLVVEGLHMLLPDVEIAGGDAGVGRQQKDDRLGAGQHRQGQFRLATQGVQARRVENTQALAQQRVIEVDDGVAPGRHQHVAGCVGSLQIVWVETQADGFLHRHAPAGRHLGEGLGHVVRIAGIQRNVHPMARRALELRDAGLGDPRFDRQ